MQKDKVKIVQIECKKYELCPICQCDPCDCYDYCIKLPKSNYNKINLLKVHIERSSLFTSIG